MEELKTKRKLTRSIMRLPNRRDIPAACTLFFISRACVLGSFPLGVAFFAAACDISAVYIYLPVLLLGLVSAGANAVKYFAASLIFWLISELTLHEKHTIEKSALCGGVVILCGILNTVLSPTPLSSFFFLLIEGVVTALMYHAFLNARLFLDRYESPRHVTREEIISFVILICSVLLGLSGIILPLGVNVAQICGIYLILCSAMYLNLPETACFSLAVGFVSSSVSSDAVMMTGITAIGGAFASLLKQYGKQGITAGFMTGVAVCFLYISGDYGIPISVIPLFFSAAMFLLTPAFIHSKLHGFFAKLFSPGCSENDLRIKNCLSDELKNMSAAFKKLSQRLLSTSDACLYNAKSHSAALFESVTARACCDCPDYDLCWRENLNETCRQMFMIIDIMEEKGFCDMTNIPIVFSQRCRTPEKFISEFNHIYEIHKQEALHRTEANRCRDIIAGQYSEISSIVKEVAASVEYGFCFMKEEEDIIYRKFLGEKAPLCAVTVLENSSRMPEVYLTPSERISKERIRKIVSSALDAPMRIYEDNGDSIHLIADNLFYTELSVKQRKKDGQAVSGDTVVSFESHDNKFYVILCDGMGSGTDACEESRMTAELLREFIAAGINSDAAIKMINASLSIKAGRELFSTVDLLEIDLLNGATRLLKVGGAQSFIKHSDSFETVYSKSLPIGIIDEVKITQFKKNLKNGDMVVMVSDGVGEADYGAMRGEWIKRLMSDEKNDANALSDIILSDALKKTFPNSPDDMTVIVTKLYKY